MAKEIKFNIKAREELKKGVDALADAVKVAMLSLKRNSELLTLQKMA